MVVPSPECREVGIVRGSRVGDRPLAPGVQVTEIEAQLLKLVRAQVVVVEEKVVPGRSGCPLRS